MGKSEILDFVKTMRAKDHAVLFYADRRDKREILFTYLKAALDTGEAAIYVASDETTADVSQAMRDFGINVGQSEKSNALRIVDYSEWYITRGQFDVSKIFSRWTEAYQQAIARGFKGLRVTGEMSCFFKHHMLNELVVYERALHKELEIPMVGICAYDNSVVVKGIEEDSYLRLYLDLIAAHGMIVFVGPEEAGILRTV